MTAAFLALNRRTFASLRKHRNYRLFFGGQVISLAGTWMQNIALAWYVVQLTHSPVAVGFLAFCRFAPFTILGLFAGVVADRFDNRRQVILTQSSSMVVSIALTALAFSGTDSLAAVYALALAGGVALVFDAPARQSLTFRMVGRDELPNAVALNTGLFNASRVSGPAIAGTIIATAGVGVCFTLWTANSQSLLQLSAPDHLRGRVLSLWLFAFAGLAPLGGLLAGWLADVGGTSLAFYVAGGTGLLMTLAAVRELYAGRALLARA